MRSIIFTLLFSSVVFGQVSMTSNEIQALQHKVKSQSELTQTIISDFVQKKHLDFLSNDIITNGQLVFKAPNKVKWAYVTPYKYSVVFKDDKLHINDEGKKSELDLSSSKMFKKLNHLIISSVKGDMFNDEEFKISYYKLNKYYSVSFNPVNSNISNYIKQIEILFSLEGEVHQIKMIEPTDDYTTIAFENRVVNKPVSNEVFNH